MNENVAKELMRAWGLSLRRMRTDLPMAGSPERSLARMVAEAETGGIFVIERIAPHQRTWRKEIGAVLQALRERGLGSIQSYLPDADGNHVHVHEGEFWQLSPYMDGVSLARPEYVHEGWRGEALAEFLVCLKRASKPGLNLSDGTSFSILRFMADLKARMGTFDPDVLEETDNIMFFLFDDFARVHERFPVVFCHGDFHPLNVIWSVERLSCVIDWEFMGNKPEIFDPANLIGCIGMEDPWGLTGFMVLDFLSALDQENFLSPISRKYLVEAVIAIRFAWLSEWLRKGDREMVDLEVVYLRLLMENRNLLKEAWKPRVPVSGHRGRG